MKTRYLTLFLTAAGAMIVFSGCDGNSNTLDPNVQARLRNNLPIACTADQIQACPAVEVARCPAGQEPVIDYSSDCCAHFTCQPLCSSAQQRTCPMTPAPACPPRTKLWIGTAIEDCCPAYRCEPDTTMCDPAREKCGCDATNAACILSLPYCGPGVAPIIVGQSDQCCPIYQCPCLMPDPVAGTPPPSAADLRYCGCTRPSCEAGYELVCEGKDACGGPCTCQPARGICKDDSNCAPDQKCDLTACRLPPMPVATDPSRAVCDAARCGPALGMPNRICADGTTAGPTGRCLANADGTCGWEVIDCPPEPGCYGICVPNAPQDGCQVDGDCGTGERCNVQCREWACVPGGTGTGTPTTTDPATGTMTSTTAPACACDLADNSCSCDASGACKGRTCVGKCEPKPTMCDPNNPVVCPTFAPVCGPGFVAKEDGVDPNTCCVTYKCVAVCDRTTTNTSTGAASVCPAPPTDCRCAKVASIDPATCCPKYECAMLTAAGTCG
jgi:hypothetical protein